MAALMPQGKQQYFTAGGIPLVGGKVYTYAAGTTTPLATYTTAAASTPNANPVILDSRGEASIFFSAANYKIVVKDSLDSTVWTQDNLPGDQAATIVANLAASTGSSLVGHIASGTGAVATTVQAKLRENVSVLDFGADPTGVADSTTAIQTALNSGAKEIVFPKGSYLVSSGLTVPNYVTLQGQGVPMGAAPGSTEIPVRINCSMASGALLTCGQQPVIKNIYFRNTVGAFDMGTYVFSGNTTTAIKVLGDAHIEECCFALWFAAIEMDAVYYVKTRSLEFNRCNYGYLNTGTSCYNVHIDAPTCRLTTIFFGATGSAYTRNIKVFGGSIEGFANVATHIFEISIFGTYFETNAPRTAVFMFDVLPNGSRVCLYGCLIYLNVISRIVNMSAVANGGITSVGNTMEGVGEAGAFLFVLPTSGNVTLSGDTLSVALTATCLYVDSVSAAGKYNITFPAVPTTNTHAAYSMKTIVSSSGIWMNGLTAAPAAGIRASNQLVCADGVSWDPLARAAGRPYWVVWQGDRWFSVSG